MARVHDLRILVPYQDAQASFPSQGDFRSVHPVDSRVTGWGNVRSFYFAAGDHTHLHETEAYLFR